MLACLPACLLRLACLAACFGCVSSQTRNGFKKCKTAPIKDTKIILPSPLRYESIVHLFVFFVLGYLIFTLNTCLPFFNPLFCRSVSPVLILLFFAFRLHPSPFSVHFRPSKLFRCSAYDACNLYFAFSEDLFSWLSHGIDQHRRNLQHKNNRNIEKCEPRESQVP